MCYCSARPVEAGSVTLPASDALVLNTPECVRRIFFVIFWFQLQAMLSHISTPPLYRLPDFRSPKLARPSFTCTRVTPWTIPNRHLEDPSPS